MTSFISLAKKATWVLLAAQLMNPIASTAKAYASSEQADTPKATSHFFSTHAQRLEERINALPDGLSNKGEIKDLYKKSMAFEARLKKDLKACYENKEKDPHIALWNDFVKHMKKSKLHPMTVLQATNMFFNTLTYYDENKKERPELAGENWQQSLSTTLKFARGQCDDAALAKAVTIKEICSDYAPDTKVEVHSGWVYNDKNEHMGRHAMVVVHISGEAYSGDITYNQPTLLENGEMDPAWKTKNGGVAQADQHKTGKGPFTPYRYDGSVIQVVGAGANGFSFSEYQENTTCPDITPLISGHDFVSVRVPGGSLDIPVRATDTPEQVSQLIEFLKKAGEFNGPAQKKNLQETLSRKAAGASRSTSPGPSAG